MDSRTWWIIVAIIVVIVILVLVAVWQGRRRTVAKRNAARDLRGRAKGNEGMAAEARRRAEAAADAAQHARSEADAQSRRAEQLETEAKYERDAVAAVERDQAETLRRADRIDPDTPTDSAGHRIEGTPGRHRAGESAIDPVTGRPVEEAARQDDPRAERPARGGQDDTTPRE